MIEAKGLSKWYGPVIGLNDVTVGIGAGVTALLGPNGAGKTTFLRLLTGQLKPSQGSITLFGEPVWNNTRVLRRLGFCPDEDAFYEFLTALEFVTTLASISGLPRRIAAEKAEETLVRVGMKDAMRRKIRGFSKGMRQRTKLAQAIVHGPDLLVLDEPFTGTDPVGRRELRELVESIAASGVQVVMSSHVLYEVEELTESIVLINRGHVAASGNIHEIRDLMDSYPHRVRIRSQGARALASALAGRDHVAGIEVSADGGTLTIHTRNPAAFFGEIPALALEAGHPVEEMTSEDDNLNAVFRYLVTK